MKRSEMVSLLSIHLNEMMFCGDPKREEESYYQAGIVLTIIESHGMLPPVIELSACGSFMKTKELLDYSEIDYEIEWEPEDD